MGYIKYTRRFRHWYETKWGKKVEPVSEKTATPSDFKAIVDYDEKERKPKAGAKAELLKLLKLKAPKGRAGAIKALSLSAIKEATNEEASLE